MFGPEWTNDEPEDRDDSQPLSPEAEPHDAPESESESESIPRTVRIITKALAQPPEPAMAHTPLSSDQAESDSSETPASARPRPRKRPGVLSAMLALLSKIPLPSLGSERHEMILDTPKADSSATATKSAEAPAHPSKRAHARFPLLGLKRETRVGLAALLSFGVLVTALLFNKGWLGGKQPFTLAMNTPTDGEASTDPKKKAEKEDKEKAKKPGDPEKGTGSSPKSEEPKQPPANSPPSPVDPQAPPSPVVEGTRATLLGSGTESAAPVALPEDPPARPPVLPTGPTETVQLPGEPPVAPPTGPDPPTLPTVPGATASGAHPDAPPPAGPPSLGDAVPTPPLTEQTPPKTEQTTLPKTEQTTPLLTEQTPPKTEAAPPTAEQAPPPTAAPAGLPTLGSPPPTDPTPPPIVASAPPPTPTPATPVRVEPTPPIRSERPPTLESVPAASSSPPASSPSEAVEPASTAGALAAGWVVVQSGGRRTPGSSLKSSSSPESSPTSGRAAANSRASDDLAVADQVEPVLHRVLPGENFWTISKLYYGQGRFYRALHAANQRQVPNIAELYVGTVVRIPPPEALDRSLIDPQSRASSNAKTDDPATSPASRTSKRAEPTEEADLAMPVRPRTSRPEPEPTREPRRPTYTVKPFETLRSIARDTLNDPKRDREIYNLNRDVLDDPSVLPAGTTLTLPEDATLGRRAR
jgi:nucleoid-associated protein YgaU